MNIILIGMPGCGKSTIGVILAKIFAMDFLDSDVFIQNNEKQKLQDIINEKGLEKFLDIECENIKKINVDNTVIATGGSVIMRRSSIMHLKKNGLVVFFDVPLFHLKKRIFNVATRGIAMKKGQGIKDVFKIRYPLYRKYADIKIKINGLTKAQTIKKTVNLINIATKIDCKRD